MQHLREVLVHAFAKWEFYHDLKEEYSSSRAQGDCCQLDRAPESFAWAKRKDTSSYQTDFCIRSQQSAQWPDEQGHWWRTRGAKGQHVDPMNPTYLSPPLRLWWQINCITRPPFPNCLPMQLGIILERDKQERDELCEWAAWAKRNCLNIESVCTLDWMVTFLRWPGIEAAG